VSLLDGLGAALGRFTMQDVGAVIYANEAWREGFQRTYLSDNLLAFIPGMFFPGKPLNPSYEINALYYNGISVISSAAPSLFGALLIATGNWLYWPALAIVVWLLGKSEQYFVRTAAPADDFSWLIVFSFALLLEGVYVAPVLFFAVAYSWRRRIIGLQRRIRERLREPTKSAIARRQIAVSV
jgi:hypothetical protein